MAKIMNIIHVDPQTVPLVVEQENALVLRTLAGQASGCPAISVTWVELDGHHRRLVSGPGTRAYFVLSGRLRFKCSGFEDIEAEKEHLLLLPPRTEYEIDGQGTYLVINAPAFQEGDDLYVE